MQLRRGEGPVQGMGADFLLCRQLRRAHGWLWGLNQVPGENEQHLLDLWSDQGTNSDVIMLRAHQHRQRPQLSLKHTILRSWNGTFCCLHLQMGKWSDWHLRQTLLTCGHGLKKEHMVRIPCCWRGKSHALGEKTKNIYVNKKLISHPFTGTIITTNRTHSTNMI